MTLDECTDLLTPLALATRTAMDVPTFIVYHAMLKSIPVELAALALEDLQSRGELEFFPSAPKIQAAAERMRRQQLALHPWAPCSECEDRPGWRVITDVHGDTRLERCSCRERHQESLKTCGLLDPIVMLPGESGTHENEQVFPRFEDLPVGIQQRLQAAFANKLLR